MHNETPRSYHELGFGKGERVRETWFTIDCVRMDRPFSE